MLHKFGCLFIVSILFASMVSSSSAQNKTEKSDPKGKTEKSQGASDLAQGMQEWLSGPEKAFKLIQVEEVQKDIKLTSEQKTKIEAIVPEMKTLLGEQNKLYGDTNRVGEWGKKLKDCQTRQETWGNNLKKLLSPRQIERINQMDIQANGVSSLPNQKIQKLLGFTKEQKKKMAHIMEEGAKEISGILMSGDTQEAKQKEKREILKEMHAKMAEVLTPEQKKKFEILKGAKIDFDASKIDI